MHFPAWSRLLAAILCWQACLPWPAQAQTVPGPAVRLIVPYPPGGTVDQIARLIATPLRPSLAQDVVVENVPGAAGALGLQRLFATPAEGHEMAIGTDSDSILVPLLNPEVRYKPSQFRPLGKLAIAPMVLVAGANLAEPDVAALAAAATGTGARSFSIGSYGVGSNAHLCAEDFAQRLALKLVHVPYKGIAALMQDLMGGHVDLAFLPLAGGVAEAVAAGRLRPLAVASATRSARFPGVPTFEQAVALRDFVHGSWSVALVPATTPEPTVQRLHKAVQDALRDPVFRKDMDTSGSAVAAPMSLAEAQRAFDAEIERYRTLTAQLQARGVSFGR